MSSANNKTLAESVVLVTGALTGIGRAAAIAFAKEGSKVVVSGRKEEAGQQLVRELQAVGATAVFIKADVSKEEEVQALVEGTVARFGRLEIAVNNAGTEGQPGPIVDQTRETYEATFDTNVLGTILSMKHELTVMLKQKSGSIVNVSSTFGKRAPRGSRYTSPATML